jgi:hypothetical protein
LSSGVVDGASGLAGPDALCQQEATSSHLEGAFRALLATSTASAVSRFSEAGDTWVRPDGIPVAATVAEFFAGGLAAPLAVTADGQYVGHYNVWTGAFAPTFASTSNCSDWTNSTGGLTRLGIAATTTLAFFSASNVYCSDFQHVYCLQE